MPHNVTGNETAYSQFGGHASSVLPDVSRLIFSGFPEGCFLLLCRAHRFKEPTPSAPHGIGGKAPHIVRIVIVGRPIGRHPDKIIGRTRVRGIESTLITCIIFILLVSLLFPNSFFKLVI
jgi:hypothetical protein